MMGCFAFFFTSAVENYEATDVKSLEELTGMTFVTFIGNLLRKRFVPIITPFIEKETDGLYKSVSSQLQKLYHFKVNVEKDHAELVKDKLSLLCGDWWENPAWGNMP